ncbi:MAG: hypothetical protein F6K19_06175 [Cyanothece sp. SIO1E1]|nr:hypothetical protein [Cyanothece sp. SIO1E1]
MTQSEPTQSDRIETLLERLTTDVGALTTDVEALTTDVEALTTDVETLKQETTRTNDKVETYQKASQQVVNLAFGLILTSTLAIIIPAIVNR